MKPNLKMKPEKLGSLSMAEKPENDREVETITLSDEDEPPIKAMKTIDPPKYTARKVNHLPVIQTSFGYFNIFCFLLENVILHSKITSN